MMQDTKLSLEENLLIKATGFSMYPFVKDSDKLMVKKVKPQDLKVGDIILYKDPINGQNICHRFVKKRISKNGLMLFARGDAGSFSYDTILENNFIGRVNGIIRNGKVLSLRTKEKIILNWFTAKFHLFFRALFIFSKQMAIYLLSLLQNFSFYRKLLKRIFYNKITYKHVIIKDEENSFIDYTQKDIVPRTTLSFKFMALYNDRIIATATLSKEESNSYKGCWVYGLNVRIKFRGAGIGENLMQKVIQFVKEKDNPFLYLDVNETNLKALSFYSKLGFKEIGFKEYVDVMSETSSVQQLPRKIIMRLDL